ncbi:MAG: threonine synthase [Anaerolineae bacterium]
MAEITVFQCTVCHQTFDPAEIVYTCPTCGEVGTLDALFDYEKLKAQLDRDALMARQEASIWRYRALLPLQPDSPVPPLRVGMTPLYDAPRLADTLGVRQAWVKDDGQNPTASYKDRASAMVVAHAMEVGYPIITTASTGNAAAALAGIGASVGLRTLIFVPAAAPAAKIAQLRVYGAEVLLIEDTYDVAFDLCLQISQEQGWYCRNTGINPYTTEGKKTASYEIAEQLGWNIPDVVVVSVGDGSIIGGLHKGFSDLHHLGWIERIPRLIGVQSSGSSPLVQAWEANVPANEMRPVPAQSLADSIVAGLPRDRVKALRAVRETNGAYIAVDDSEILAAIPQFARLTGVFAEPAAAASLAGAKRAVETGHIHPEESVVIVSTGNGLKDVLRAQQAISSGTRVAPTLAAVKNALQLD